MADTQFNKCMNIINDKQFYKSNKNKYNYCLDNNIQLLTNKYNTLCKCENGTLGFTETGNIEDCNCNGTYNNKFTYFDNYNGDLLIEKVLIYRTLILIILFIPLIYSYKKASHKMRYMPNKIYESVNSKYVPIFFSILCIYIFYELYYYFN